MGKKFNRIGKSMGKTTIPGTDIKMPFGMNRGEYAAIQTGITGIVGKKKLDDRFKEKQRDDRIKTLIIMEVSENENLR